MSRPRKTMREKMSEWVLHCAVDQRHTRRSQPTRDAALEDACSQLLQGHVVNRIIGPNETRTKSSSGARRSGARLRNGNFPRSRKATASNYSPLFQTCLNSVLG